MIPLIILVILATGVAVLMRYWWEEAKGPWEGDLIFVVEVDDTGEEGKRTRVIWDNGDFFSKEFAIGIAEVYSSRQPEIINTRTGAPYTLPD